MRIFSLLICCVAIAACDDGGGTTDPDAATDAEADAGSDTSTPDADSDADPDADADDAGSDAEADAEDAGSDAETDAEDAGSDAEADAEGDSGPACTPGVACGTNPGAECRGGLIDCTTGTETCVDGAPVDDGTACTAGVCVAGECLGTTEIATDVTLNLSTDSTTGGDCGDGAAFGVTGFSDTTTAGLATDPMGCLSPGDEVLLINLQGAPGETVNVGNWELLTVDTVSVSAVGFTSPKTRFYGNAADSDANIGVAAGQQRVSLIRVPHYGTLNVMTNASVTASGFDGQTGGVVVLRADTLTLDGSISAIGLGYRNGRWSRDGGCEDSVTTESGESISGPGTQSTSRNTGGPGGVGALDDVSFNGSTPLTSSAGHAGAGEPGLNGNGRTIGEPGEAYGVDDGTSLTMGSGGAGGLTCGLDGGLPVLTATAASTAGGIILLLLGDVVVNATGSITSSAGVAGRDVAASGGYVMIVGRDLNVGAGLVTAVGGIGMGVGATEGLSNTASEGYIVLEASGTISGTTNPIATTP